MYTILYPPRAPTQPSTRTYISVLVVEYRFARIGLLPFLLGRISFCLIKCPELVMMQIHPFCWADPRVARTVTFSWPNCAFNGSCDGTHPQVECPARHSSMTLIDNRPS